MGQPGLGQQAERWFHTGPGAGVAEPVGTGTLGRGQGLDSGRIRAAIDVWPSELIPANEAGRTSRNTVIQAHRAGNIPEIWPEMGRMVVDDSELVLRGLPPQRCQRAVPEVVNRLRSKPVT